MKPTYFSFIQVFVFICLATTLNGQVYSGVNKSDVTRELNKRNITEAELRQATEQIGLEIDSIAFFTPLEINALEGVIVELENRKKSAIGQDSIPLAQNLPTGLNTDTNKSRLDSLAKIDSMKLIILDTLPTPIRYGQSIFRDRVLALFESGKQVKAPTGYILGPGDEVNISIWGKSSIDESYELDSKGQIRVLNDKVKVNLNNLTLSQAKDKLRTTYSQYYSFDKGQFEVDLKYGRTVQVSVYGEVFKPGPITASALNDAFTVLAATDGPTNIGSLRAIQLIRADGTREVLDIYEYLNNPKPRSKYYLQDGDVILVPPMLNIVTIDGAIRRPYEYEMLESETLKDLIDYSGGFNGNADKRYAQVSRFENNAFNVIDVNISNGEASRFKLFNGDSIYIRTIDSMLVSFVEVLGAVDQEGKYQFTKGMRVGDLLQKSGLKADAKMDLAFLKRHNPDSTQSFINLDLDAIYNGKSAIANIELQPKDVLTINSLKDFSDYAQVKLAGAVRKAGSIDYDVSQNIRIREAIIMAGGLRRDASNTGIIHRQDPLNPRIKEYVTLENLEELMESESPEFNVILSPFDSIYIYSKFEILDDAIVTIEGAVNNPGKFQYGLDMSLKDILVLAGGVKLNAALNRVEVSRVNIHTNESTTIDILNLAIDENYNIIGSSSGYKLEPFDVVTVRYVPDFELQKRIEITGEVVFPGRYTIVDDNEKLSNFIQRAGGLTEEAFPPGATLYRENGNLGAVVIKLDEVIRNNKSQFNFIMKDGDVINIPKQKEFVTIEGATRVETVLANNSVNFNNRIHVPFTEGKNASYYINQYAGGLSKKASRTGVFVEYPNGEVKRSRNYLFFVSTPKVKKGSVIKVREKEVKVSKENEKTDVDWERIFGSSIEKAISVLTLVLLYQQTR